MAFNNPQEQFWAQDYARDYIARNNSFDHDVGAIGWRRMLARTQRPIRNFLECGCNIGRNLHQLARALPEATPSIIEISTPAFEVVSAEHSLEHAFNGAILDAPLPEQGFDLVFTMGVLIHIHPDLLLQHMARMHALSSRYVLMGEYFNDTPTQITYRDQSDRLFKRDFGKLFHDNFDVQVVDYGFLWSTELGAGGFDNITWWLFEKRTPPAGHA